MDTPGECFWQIWNLVIGILPLLVREREENGAYWSERGGVEYSGSPF